MLYKSRLLLLHGTCQFRRREAPDISIYVFKQLQTPDAQNPLLLRVPRSANRTSAMEILYGKGR